MLRLYEQFIQLISSPGESFCTDDTGNLPVFADIHQYVPLVHTIFFRNAGRFQLSHSLIPYYPLNPRRLSHITHISCNGDFWKNLYFLPYYFPRHRENSEKKRKVWGIVYNDLKILKKDFRPLKINQVEDIVILTHKERECIASITDRII